LQKTSAVSRPTETAIPKSLASRTELIWLMAGNDSFSIFGLWQEMTRFLKKTTITNCDKRHHDIYV